jgi:TIR domain
MAFTVFVSHKYEDMQIAMLVAKRLEANQVNCYLDGFDPEARDAPALNDYLKSKLKTSHALMAVVSKLTITSWWVPWEIGVASERDMPLATFSHDASSVPSFLRKWPYMTNLPQIDQYADLAKRMVRERTVLKEDSRPAEALSGVHFNRSLQITLGQ